MSTRSSTSFSHAARARSLENEASECMQEAIGLARCSGGLAHPNPRVGCVIVKNGRKVGEGFHAYDKLDHAEIVALRAARAAARGSTLYVNLEPCSHTGRTGPCTRAIIDAGVKRVVAAMQDPNPKVAGKGFAQLRRAGVKVEVGVREDEARALNEDFAKWIQTRQPFVILKSALTLDGRIAAEPGKPTPITGEVARAAVQRMRHQADAIITGIGTVLADDPLLTDRTREPRRRKLLRVVLDAHLRIPIDSRLVKSADDDLLVIAANGAASGSKARALRREGVEVLSLPARRGHIVLPAVLRELGRRETLNVLLEAGAQVNGAALAAGIVDKIVLFYAPYVIGAGGVPMAQLRNGKRPPVLLRPTLAPCGKDFILQGYVRDVYGHHRSYRKN